MPCYTRIVSTSVQLHKLDRARLARTLEKDGWTVYVGGQEVRWHSGRIGTLPAGDIAAHKNGITVRVTSADARVIGSSLSEAQALEIADKLTKSYTVRTVQEVSARFGFRASVEEKDNQGAIKIALRR